MKKIIILLPLILSIIVIPIGVIVFLNEDAYTITKNVDENIPLSMNYSDNNIESLFSSDSKAYFPFYMINVAEEVYSVIQIGTEYNSMYKLEYNNNELDVTFQHRLYEYPNYNYNFESNNDLPITYNNDFFMVNTDEDYKIKYVGDKLFYYELNSEYVYLISVDNNVQKISIDENIDGFNITYKDVFESYGKYIFLEDNIIINNEDGSYTDINNDYTFEINASYQDETSYFYDYDDNTLIFKYTNDEYNYSYYVYNLDTQELNHFSTDNYFELLNYERIIYE